MPRSSNAEVGWCLEKNGRYPVSWAAFPSGRVVIEDGESLLITEELDALPANAEPRGEVRPGVMDRVEDSSGVSGTGVVADFVEFPSGRVVIEWRNEDNDRLDTDDSGLDLRPSMDLAVEIHGHGGRTQFRYDDGEVAG